VATANETSKTLKEGVGHVTTEIDPNDTAPADEETTNKRLSTLEEDLLLKELLETAEPRDPIQTQLAVQRIRRTTPVTEEGAQENQELSAAQEEARDKIQAEFDTENQNSKATELPLSSAWAEEKKGKDALRIRHAAARQKLLESGYFSRVRAEAKKAAQKRMDEELANADNARFEADQAEEERLDKEEEAEKIREEMEN
jgi:hypothetical protein